MPVARGRFGAVLLAFGTVLLTLLVLEGAFRVGRRLQSGGGKEQGSIALYTEYDPVLGWRKRPGAAATFRRREYTAEVKINERGLRDRPRAYEANGSFRILALGDSFVEAYSVPLESSVTQVMEASLTTTDCPVEVINGGTAAWSTDQEYLFYVREGQRYGPRVVLLFFYYNDVFFNGEDTHFGTPKPLLVEEDGRLRLAQEPVPHPRTPVARRPPEEEPEPWWRSALLEWARGRLMRGAPRTHDALARLGLWTPILASEPHAQLKVYKRRLVPEVERGWESTTRIVDALRKETANRDARLLLVYVPSRMEVRDGDWELTRRRYGMREPLWDRDLVRERLREVAGAAGVLLLDLTGSLRQEDRGLSGGVYYTLDGHWNARGHQVAARELVRFLRARGWLPECVRIPS
jgi:lysophospholipase L1-like esterase